MDRLPVEILIDILGYLPELEIWNQAGQTNHAFRYAAALATRGRMHGLVYTVWEKVLMNSDILSTDDIKNVALVSKPFNYLLKSSKHLTSMNFVLSYPANVQPFMIATMTTTQPITRYGTLHLWWTAPNATHAFRLSAFTPPAHTALIRYGSVPGLLRPIRVVCPHRNLCLRDIIHAYQLLTMSPLTPKQESQINKYKKFQDFMLRIVRSERREVLTDVLKRFAEGDGSDIDYYALAGRGFKGLNGFQPDRSVITVNLRGMECCRGHKVEYHDVMQRNLLGGFKGRDSNVTVRVAARQGGMVVIDLYMLGPENFIDDD